MGTGGPDKNVSKEFSSFTHSTAFVEVRIDETLGVLRVTRIVNVAAAGRILNPKTARSQIIGGVVFGMGMALYEESMPDHAQGRFMNHNFAEYHLPTNADVPMIEVIFVDESDKLNPRGVKGLHQSPPTATLPRSAGFGMRAGWRAARAKSDSHTKGRSPRALV